MIRNFFEKSETFWAKCAMIKLQTEKTMVFAVFLEKNMPKKIVKFLQKTTKFQK